MRRIDTLNPSISYFGMNLRSWKQVGDQRNVVEAETGRERMTLQALIDRKKSGDLGLNILEITKKMVIFDSQEAAKFFVEHNDNI